MPEIKKTVVLGLGYIGLPTASMLANRGIDVLGVDVNPRVVDTINSGKIHIVEPDLDILVRAAVNSGRLRASDKPATADAFIIAVPTPFKHGAGNRHEPDLRYVDAAAAAIIPHLRRGNLVILESTSPVGTTERIYRAIAEARPEIASAIHAAHCPERVLPGHILKELVENDRVIGGVTPAATRRAADLYRAFCVGQILLTDSRTAELTKLVENSFRDVNIAFANEMSMICDRLGVDVWELIALANRHPRVNILQPGPGVGGHCIAVDPWFLAAAAPEQARLIRTAREVNDSKPGWVVQKVKDAAAEIVRPVVGCLGLTFKANVDDIRESPALGIVRQLMAEKGFKVMACDPYLDGAFKEFKLFSLEAVLQRAEIVVALVDHDVFRNVDRRLLHGKQLIDTRGIWRNA